MVVREQGGRWEVAVIKPRGRDVLALPKGHLDDQESAVDAATREVNEETGLAPRLMEKLGDVKYVYRFRGKTIFKVVSFFLFRDAAGEIDQITEKMRVEVDVAKWLPLDEAVKKLSYPGERDMAGKALAYLSRQSAPAP